MRAVLFQVASIQPEGQRLFVGGRNCGDPMTLGDVVSGPGGDVRVEAILTYRRYLNVLEPGLTGELELSGAGIAAIRPGSEIIGTPKARLPALEVLGEGEPHVRPA